ncbi:UDP-glucose 4-epimerase [Acinetobacter calcoaceticus]|uniref:UDP-glucose 4-epimerase n=1 Tax=Acinetobacter calcoaceticus TaxID=471 RepID=A0A4V2R1F4_ACICA|nr:UDP-glucose 4-epimerase [Acinetobacter calcoaceticus]
MSTYLVTGAAGFIGSHICEELLKDRNNLVIGVDNFYSGNQENIDLLLSISDNFIFYNVDIRNYSEICEIMQKHEIKYVFHQAAIASVQMSVDNPILTNDVNIAGSLSILEAARQNKIKRILFASSAAVYGDEPTLPKNEKSPLKPISPYGLEKLVTEQYMRLYSEQYGVECVALRYFNVYGPRQDPNSEYSGVISIFTNRIKSGLPITVFGDGEQYRDFIYVKDVVKTNVELMHSNLLKTDFEVVCVGTGLKTSLNKLISVLIKDQDYSDLNVRYESFRSGDINKSICDNYFLRSLINNFNFNEIENTVLSGGI